MLFLVLIVAVFLTASIWPARLTLRNKSGGDLYLYLKGASEYYLTVQNLEAQVFTIERGVYFAEVKACGYTAKGSIDATHNLRLTFPDCMSWATMADKWSGERGFEKFNPVFGPGVYWQFVY
jgi:hypothetical protein